MAKGKLSEYFTGVASKQLSRVETDLNTSNQHEINGLNRVRQILGTPPGKTIFQAQFIYLTDDDPEPVLASGPLTWYDARENDPKRSAEWRLYYPTNGVTQIMAEGDQLIVALLPDGSLLFVVAESESTIAAQMLWLFGLGDATTQQVSVRVELETGQDRLGFAERLILESIGVVDDPVEETALDRMLRVYKGDFPKTAEFSAFSRELVGDVDPVGDPDGTLLAWLDKEEILFRTLETHLIGNVLERGFGEDGRDVPAFNRYSLQVQNRRKARAGQSLEHHVAAVLDANGVTFDRGVRTEKRAKPDFLFPGKSAYDDPEFDSALLTMLATKSTCKDRWRQVLSEAKRIKQKHLLTLEPGISIHQTGEMQDFDVQLVLPAGLHGSYTDEQQTWLLNVREMIDLAQDRAARAA